MKKKKLITKGEKILFKLPLRDWIEIPIFNDINNSKLNREDKKIVWNIVNRHITNFYNYNFENQDEEIEKIKKGD